MYTPRIPFTKVIHIGSSIFCKIEFNDKQNLSITGVIRPDKHGNAETCGQICDSIKEYLIDFVEGWNTKRLDTFIEYWKEYHLNDMKAGCKHQRENWDTNKEIILDSGETKTVNWIYEKDHPDGILCKPCEVCGYKYGSKWLRKEVPTKVLYFLYDLPDASRKPAWV